MIRIHSLEIASVRPDTEAALRVRFTVPEDLAADFRHAPGQHVNLRARVNGEELRRSYSICSVPGDPGLEICIRRVPGGRFSEWAHATLAPGQRLDVMTPGGRFHTPFDPAQAKHYVAFAAGIGITPIYSLAAAALATEPRSHFTLFYGNRTIASIAFREEIEDLKNRYLERFSRHHVLSREPQDADIYNGRLDGARAAALYRDFCAALPADEVFVCGPAGMLDEVREAIARCGVPAARIHFERFGTVRAGAVAPPPASQPAHAFDARITVVMGGRRTEFGADREGPGLVDAARVAGLDLPYSCKSGVCSTCRTKVVEGRVTMDENYALEPWELEAGFVLACQAHPVTDRVTLDYDQT